MKNNQPLPHEITKEDVYSRGIGFSPHDKIFKKQIKPIGKVTQIISNDSISYKNEYMAIDTESLLGTDNLSNIFGGNIGDEIVLESVASTRQPTIKNAVGNLYLTSDFTLTSPYDKITLKKAKNNEWHELSRSNNG